MARDSTAVVSTTTPLPPPRVTHSQASFFSRITFTYVNSLVRPPSRRRCPVPALVPSCLGPPPMLPPPPPRPLNPRCLPPPPSSLD